MNNELHDALDKQTYVGRFLLRVRPGGHYMLMRVLPDDTVVAGRHSFSLPGVNDLIDRANEATDRDIAESIAEAEEADQAAFEQTQTVDPGRWTR